MICKHQFIPITDVQKLPKGSNLGSGALVVAIRAIPGAEVGCALCGQIRHIYSDGSVVIEHEGGEPIEEDYDERRK